MHSLILRKNDLSPPLKSIWICDRNCAQRSRSLWSGGLTAQTLTATICPNISRLSALIFQVKTGKGGCSFSLRISMCQADAHIKRSERWRHESEDDDVRKTTSTFRHTQRKRLILFTRYKLIHFQMRYWDPPPPHHHYFHPLNLPTSILTISLEWASPLVCWAEKQQLEGGDRHFDQQLHRQSKLSLNLEKQSTISVANPGGLSAHSPPKPLICRAPVQLTPDAPHAHTHTPEQIYA